MWVGGLRGWLRRDGAILERERLGIQWNSRRVAQNKMWNKQNKTFPCHYCRLLHFFLPCQTKTLPLTASSSSPTFQFLSYSNVSQTARCTSQGRKGEQSLERVRDARSLWVLDSFILQPHSGSLSLKSRPSQEKFQTIHFHSLSETKHITNQQKQQQYIHT